MTDEQAERALRILYELRMRQLGVTGTLVITKESEEKCSGHT